MKNKIPNTARKRPKVATIRVSPFTRQLRDDNAMAASIWRGRITFGLVSIPVRLVKAARRERTRFRRVQRVRSEEPPIDFGEEVPETPVQPSKVLRFPPMEEDAGAPRDSTALPSADETVV